MGCESGSQKILDAMDKGIRVEQVHEARERLRQHGIRACFFLQFGYPGEGWSEIEATIRMVRETRPDDIGVSVSYPLPGTTFHRNVYTQIGPRSNWSDSADLAMVFQGAYPSESLPRAGGSSSIWRFAAEIVWMPRGRGYIGSNRGRVSRRRLPDETASDPRVFSP